MGGTWYVLPLAYALKNTELCTTATVRYRENSEVFKILVLLGLMFESDLTFQEKKGSPQRKKNTMSKFPKILQPKKHR